MSHRNMRRVLRYRSGQRVVHWILALSFLLLLITGLALLLSPLSFLTINGLSRQLHKIGAVLFLLVPILYLLLDRDGLKELVVESFQYDGDDWRWFKRMPQYLFGRAKGMPPQGRLNAGQKLHHAGIIVTFFTIALSGLVLWLGKGNLGAAGLAAAAIVHDLSMLAMVVLLVGHVYFTFVYGALSGMISGYISEESARLEHARWVASLPQKAPWFIEPETVAEESAHHQNLQKEISSAGAD